MAQLRLGYPEFQRMNAEILQVTHSAPEEARLYFQYGRLAFPYLCDPDRVVHGQYGIQMEEHPPADGLRNLLACTLVAATDLVVRGERPVSPISHFKRHGAGIRRDTPQAMFVIDREGIIRSLSAAGPIGAIPPTADLLRALAALQ